VCTTPGTPQRWASASQCTNTRLPERAKPKKLRTRQSGIKPAGSMFCWMPGCCPTTHLAEDGSLDQAERCPVESWIVMSTTSLNTTHPPVVHGYDTRLLRVIIMATACSVGAKAKMWQIGPSVDFLFATSNVDPWKHVHPRDASGCYLCSNHHASGSLVQAETRQSRPDETAPWR
jgi:hypothetical protein